MNFHQVLLVLRARWRVSVGLFVAVLAAVVAYTFLSTKLYMATASVVVDAKTDPVAGIVYPAQLLSSYIATQVDIISSERVARRVVKTMKLDQSLDVQRQWRESTNGRGDLPSWLAQSLQRKLIVAPSRDSNVINISFTLPDPKAAAAVANAFAQAYIDTNIELKVDPARQYASWFDERSRVLRADLEVKQKRLSDYQSKTGIIATDERVDIENARLAELSTQLVTIEAQRQDSQSRQKQIKGDNETLPEVLQNPLVSGLKANLSQAEAKLQDIATNLGKNHPDYQTTAAEVASLRDRIAQETAKIVASLGNTTQVNLRRESDISAALEAQKKRVLELKHQRDEASDLQNDVLSAQRNLDAVSQRLAQTSLESQTEQTNAVLLTPATEPLFPSKPRVLLYILVGLFIGFLFSISTALFLEIMSRRVRSDEEVLQMLGVPLLANIPSIKFWPKTTFRGSGTGMRKPYVKSAIDSRKNSLGAASVVAEVPSATDGTRDRSRAIGGILVDQGRLTPKDVDEIERFASEHGLRFGDAAVQLNRITPEDVNFAIARQFNYPILARGEDGVADDVVAAYRPQSDLIEPLRALRSQLLLRWLNNAGPNKVLAIASPGRREGRSWLAANLATVFAQNGERTLLIDANMRHPRQHELFNLSNELGLSALLTGRGGREIVRRIHPQLRLYVLPAGIVPPNPQELLGRFVFDAILDRFSEQYSVVIIDTPAATDVADAQIIAARAGAAVLIARRNQTRHTRLLAAMQSFTQTGVNVIGSVINEY